MTNAAKKLLTQIDALPEDDRRWLTDVLIVRREVDGPVDYANEWRTEVLRRHEQIDRGEVTLEPWSEVRQHIRAALAERE